MPKKLLTDSNIYTKRKIFCLRLFKRFEHLIVFLFLFEINQDFSLSLLYLILNLTLKIMI